MIMSLDADLPGNDGSTALSREVRSSIDRSRVECLEIMLVLSLY